MHHPGLSTWWEAMVGKFNHTMNFPNLPSYFDISISMYGMRSSWYNTMRTANSAQWADLPAFALTLKRLTWQTTKGRRDEALKAKIGMPWLQFCKRHEYESVSDRCYRLEIHKPLLHALSNNSAIMGDTLSAVVAMISQATRQQYYVYLSWIEVSDL